MELQYPLCSDIQTHYPADQMTCAYCRRSIKDSSTTVVIAAGALANEVDTDLNGFLEFRGYGTINGIVNDKLDSFVVLHIADDVVDGQAEIILCSVSCARSLLLLICDDLERRMQER